MQGADDAGCKVGAAIVGVNQVAVVAAEGDGHGVDGEIAAGQVVGDTAGLHVGQGAGSGVGFAAGGYEVNPGQTAGQVHRSGAEPGMNGHPSAEGIGQFLSQGRGAAHHGDVQVLDRRAEEVVAHRAADQIGGHPGIAGQFLNLAEQVGDWGVGV